MAWVGGVLNLVGGRRDNYFNKEEADKARDWSKDMSNTEIQRRVQDMKLAGINPMLAASSGGASTPGAAVSAPSTSGRSLGDSVMGAYFSAQQMKMMKEKNAADVAQVEANTAKTVAETELINRTAPDTARKLAADADLAEKQWSLVQEQVNSIVADIRSKNFDFTEMKDLQLQAQKYVNESTRLGLSEKEAISKLYEQFPDLKWVEVLKGVFPSLDSLRRIFTRGK